MTISVIVATYGEDTWETLASHRAVPSLTNQLANDDTFVIRHETEGTRSSSLNNGAAQAAGDWLVFLDADDELAPCYVGEMRRAAEQLTDGEPVLLTPATQFIRGGRPAAPGYQKEVPLETGNWLVIGTMIQRSLFMEIGGFHDHPHGLEDWNLWARAVRAGARILKVPEAVYRYHLNPQSMHRKFFRGKEFQAAYEKARLDAWG